MSSEESTVIDLTPPITHTDRYWRNKALRLQGSLDEHGRLLEQARSIAATLEAENARMARHVRDLIGNVAIIGNAWMLQHTLDRDKVTGPIVDLWVEGVARQIPPLLEACNDIMESLRSPDAGP